MGKVLLAYFSHAGENYTHGKIGHLEVGNTKVVALKIKDMIDCDLFYIDTIKPYPASHIEKIKIAKQEYESDARPALTSKVENFDVYDTIILGFPNWWTTMPMALFTFLESYDFSNKTICPFITHGGSGFSNSLNDIKKLCPNAKVTEGLAINGDEAVNSDLRIKKWLNSTIK